MAKKATLVARCESLVVKMPYSAVNESLQLYSDSKLTMAENPDPI